MKKAIVLIMTTACALFAGLPGCGDKGTNSVPSELIGTWWYMSSTLNGDPYDWFGYYGGDFGDTTSTTYNADRSWTRIVYDESLSAVQTAEGYFSVKGDSLIVTTTTLDGSPLQDPIVMGYTYTVVDNQLTITLSAEVDGNTEITVITYIKEPALPR